MLCSETGSQEVVHLPYLKLPVAQDINDTIAEVQRSERGEGSVTLKIIASGVSVIDKLVRKFTAHSKHKSASPRR